MVTKKMSAQERKLQVLLKEADEKYLALQAEHEGLWADFEKVQKFSSARVGEVIVLKEKYEPKITPVSAATRKQEKQQQAQLDQLLRQQIEANLFDVNQLGWLVGTGPESASAKIDGLVELLNNELNGDSELLVKTMRVARNAVLRIYDGVVGREFAAMVQCSCSGEGWTQRRHYPWPRYTAGCFTQESERGTQIGGRLWDVAEFLRLHHGYEKPKLVARTIILALQQIADDVRSREKDLMRLLDEIKKPVVAAAA